MTPVVGPASRIAASSLAAAAEAAGLVPSLDVEPLFRAAGSNPDDDRVILEPLEAIVDSARGELALGVRGRALLAMRFTSILRSRRWLRERDLEASTAGEARTGPMLFVTGFPRTGTTLTHRLLAHASDALSPRWYEVMEPTLDPDLPTETARKDRRRRARIACTGINLLSPGLRRVHEILAEGPEECTHLHEATFDSESFALAGPCRDYREWIDQRDAARRRYRYEWQERCLAAILEDRPETERSGRWVLKAPQHLLQIEELLQVFPDAKVVRMHRDPISTMTSTASLVRHTSRVVGGRVEGELGTEILEIFQEWQDRGDAGAASNPNAVLDVHYDDLVAAPLETISRIHRFAGVPFSTGHAELVHDHLKSRPRHHFGRHRYRPTDFGIDVEEARDRLSTYQARLDSYRIHATEPVGLR